jgi:hypothetical protein
MKNNFTLTLLFSALLITGCSKDIFKRYEKRILGTWHIVDINRTGIGGSTNELPFQPGTITFNEDRSLTYVSPAGDLYQGHWDIDKDFEYDDNAIRTLQLTVVDFNTQRILTEFYEEVNFRGTDHFVAKVKTGLQIYVTHFRR